MKNDDPSPENISYGLAGFIFHFLISTSIYVVSKLTGNGLDNYFMFLLVVSFAFAWLTLMGMDDMEG
jgi:hypothetical protein